MGRNAIADEEREQAANEAEGVQSNAADSQIDQSASLKYWNSVSPDVSGMLAGFHQLSRIDLRGSNAFLTKLRRRTGQTSSSSSGGGDGGGGTQVKLDLGVDCGAGIGRVTTGFLSNVCQVVDIVEPVEKFTRPIIEGDLKLQGKVGDVFTVGLENWKPAKTYDLIWNQWCVGHLTDVQLVAYLRRCTTALANDGWIVLKENLSTKAWGEDVYDELDSSVTRSDQSFRRLFALAGLAIVSAELQTGFPKGLGLFPVKMYALRPK